MPWHAVVGVGVAVVHVAAGRPAVVVAAAFPEAVEAHPEAAARFRVAEEAAVRPLDTVVPADHPDGTP